MSITECNSTSLHQSPLFTGRQIIDRTLLSDVVLIGPRYAIVDDLSALPFVKKIMRAVFFTSRWTRLKRQYAQQYGFKITGAVVAIPDLVAPTFIVELNRSSLRYYRNSLCLQNDRSPLGWMKQCIRRITTVPIEAGALIIFAEQNGSN